MRKGLSSFLVGTVVVKSWGLYGASDCPEVARMALRERHRQVGDLVLDLEGVALRGLLFRHLVMPGEVAGTRPVREFIARRVLMDIERVFAIGDIHGCLDKLVPLMNMIQLNPDQDLLLFIGDYIDRGVHSREVVDYLVDLRQRLPESIFLLGNHEQMFLEYLDGRDTDAFLHNGGEKTLRSYLGSQPPGSLAGQHPWLPPAHLDFYRSLRSYFEWEDYIFVHAGLRNGVPLAQQNLFDLIWIREEFFYSAYDFGKNIVFGHTPFPQPFIHNHRIGIDTGAVYGNRLTCLELPAVKFYAV